MSDKKTLPSYHILSQTFKNTSQKLFVSYHENKQKEYSLTENLSMEMV
jgi:hypothetical protein